MNVAFRFRFNEWKQGGKEAQLRAGRGIMLSILIILMMVSRVSIAMSTMHTNKENVVGPRFTYADYVPWDPIIISSDEDFINQGWPGSGTANDPFLISGLIIEADELCLGIFNTTSHFVIRNCNFTMNTNISYPDDGILLENVINGVVENNEISRNRIGIRLYNITQCRILSNTLFENIHSAMNLRDVYSSVISSNTITNRVSISLWPRWSISLSGCFNCTLANNTLYGGIGGNSPGISIYDTYGCILENNTIESCEYGIEIQGTSSRVTENTISNCMIGIELQESTDCIIVDNLVYNNTEVGIWLDSSRNCTLDFNRVHQNFQGIELQESTDCIIVDNLVYNNTEAGISLVYYCAHNRVYGNKIGWNGQNAECYGTNNSWDDGIGRGNSWSDLYFMSIQYNVPGVEGCIDYYPSHWIIFEGSISIYYRLLNPIIIIALVIALIGVSRRISAKGGKDVIIASTRYRLVSWFRKRKGDQDDIVVPTRYRLVSWFHKRSSIKHANDDERLEQDSSDQ